MPNLVHDCVYCAGHEQPQASPQVLAQAAMARGAQSAVPTEPKVRQRPSSAEVQATFKRCNDICQDAMARFHQSSGSAGMSAGTLTIFALRSARFVQMCDDQSAAGRGHACIHTPAAEKKTTLAYGLGWRAHLLESF